MRSDILAMARELGVMLATAESCTAGMVATALTDLPGSSHVFDRGFVTYTNAAKMQMLGVAQATLDAHGAVSEAVAKEMAQGALERSDASLTISLSGIAGPGGSEHKPEGRVCFGLARSGHVTTETVEFGAMGREAVRAASRDHALGMILGALREMASK